MVLINFNLPKYILSSDNFLYAVWKTDLMDSVDTKSFRMFLLLHKYSHLSLSSQICANPSIIMNIW